MTTYKNRLVSAKLKKHSFNRPIIPALYPLKPLDTGRSFYVVCPGARREGGTNEF